jgi:hypothetical protein
MDPDARPVQIHVLEHEGKSLRDSQTRPVEDGDESPVADAGGRPTRAKVQARADILGREDVDLGLFARVTTPC